MSAENQNYNPAAQPRTAADKAFRISLYLKGLDGLLETIGGIALFFIKPEQINHLAQWLTQSQLSRNSNDYIAHHILKTAHELTGASLIFGAIYLLAQGLIKIFIVIQVFRGQLWAYLVLIGVISLFVVYQIYRLVLVKFSVSLLLLTLFDILIIYLAQNEYRRHMELLKNA
jgi:uncharacterized membrane protein